MCQTADWFAEGYTAGRTGDPDVLAALASRQDACGGELVEGSLFQLGFREGRDARCLPRNAYADTARGEAGFSDFGVCAFDAQLGAWLGFSQMGPIQRVRTDVRNGLCASPITSSDGSLVMHDPCASFDACVRSCESAGVLDRLACASVCTPDEGALAQ
ncbi:MAG: hypothetical protein AAF830_08465 [Pseudomonadota bacterium]